ncbi:MAG TPA: SusD/RagB family nutrient-binding outer membrane lipoprotein, partial [Cyclobacteriaceae bacterium]|nr:SusD/RagB family nutrient-binding outer membrane lipoprotein [Cyclobacteriaceae bacterium]
MKRIVIILIALIAITSCQDYLDVNKDPNNASQTTPALTLPAGIASAAGQFASYYNIVGGMWVQYWTQNNGSNQYKNIDSYNVQQSTLNTNFNELYSGSLEDLQYVRNESKKAGDWNLYLMGTVMQCYVFQMLADTYDQIAFDEALHGSEILHPNYRSGQQVYDSLIVRLDDALSKDFDAITVTNPGSSDFLFGGSVTSWIQFANTLKLKIYLRQIYARPEVANPGIQGLYDNGAEFLAESAAMTQFVDQENKSNPLYECDQRKLNTAQNIKASKTFVDFLLTNSDPRVDALFIPGSGGQKGLEQGNFGAPTTVVNPASIS